jgi:hypothetical protein
MTLTIQQQEQIKGLFLAGLFILTLGRLILIQPLDLSQIQYLDFLSWLNLLSNRKILAPLSLILYVVFFVSFALFCFSKYKKSAFFMVGSCFFLANYIYFSFLGKISSGSNSFLFATFAYFVSLFFSNQDHAAKIWVKSMQLWILSSYFNAGLWKLRSFPQNFQFVEIVKEQFATSFVTEGAPNAFVLESIQNPSLQALLGLGFALTLIFQLTSFLPLFFPRLMVLYGIMSVIFHSATGLFLGVWFNNFILANLLFLVLPQVGGSVNFFSRKVSAVESKV